MKKLLFIFLISQINFAQVNLETVSNQACQCLYKIDFKETHSEKLNEVNKCVNESIISNKLDITDKEILSIINENLFNFCYRHKILLRYNFKQEDYFTKNGLAKSYFNKAINDYQKKDYEASILSYKRAVLEDPDFIMAYNNLGSLYKNLEDYDNAIKCFDNVLQVDSINETALTNKANVLIAKREFNKAINVFKKALEIYPYSAKLYSNISEVYYYKNDYDLAIKNVIVAYNLSLEEKSHFAFESKSLLSFYFNELRNDDKTELLEKLTQKYIINLKN